MTVLWTLAATLMAPAHAGVEDKLTKKYGKQLGCDALTAQEVPGSRGVEPGIRHYQVAGCDQAFHAAILFKAWQRRYDDLSLLRRAPLDLECDAVEITWIDPKTRSVTGCGRRATYVYSGTLTPIQLAGSWVANTQSTASPAQP